MAASPYTNLFHMLVVGPYLLYAAKRPDVLRTVPYVAVGMMLYHAYLFRSKTAR